MGLGTFFRGTGHDLRKKDGDKKRRLFDTSILLLPYLHLFGHADQFVMSQVLYMASLAAKTASCVDEKVVGRGGDEGSCLTNS